MSSGIFFSYYNYYYYPGGISTPVMTARGKRSDRVPVDFHDSSADHSLYA